MSNMQALALITLIFSSVCAYTDYKFKKIFNWATFPMLIVGVLYHGITAGQKGLMTSGAGILIVMPLLVFFVLRMLGAGDVKLFMALGAWYGKEDIIWVMLYSVAVGGVIAIFLMIKRKNFMPRMKFLWEYFRSALLLRKTSHYHNLEESRDATFRFAPAITMGVLLFAVFGKW